MSPQCYDKGKKNYQIEKKSMYKDLTATKSHKF